VPDRSTLAVLIYGCRGFGRVEDTDRVGEGVEQESQPLSGDVGKTTFSGRARCADCGVLGDSIDGLDENMRLCN